MVPDQDLLLGLRLSLSREPGLPWGLYLPQALLGQSQSVCAVSAQDNCSIHMPECTSPTPHTHIHPHPFFFPCRTGPHLTQPNDCSREVLVLCPWTRSQLQFGMAGEPAGHQSPERWGRGGTGSSSDPLTHRALRRHPPHPWSPLVLIISGQKTPEVKGM